jgi:uncharacterized protein (TIGR03435 family)
MSPRGALEMEGWTLDSAAALLSLILDRPVIDKTVLTSQFEIHLVFSPDESPASRPWTARGGFVVTASRVRLERS